MVSLYVSYVAGRWLELVTPGSESDVLATVLSRPACVMIMSDCKSCVLFLSKKRQERMRDPFFLQKVGWF